MSELTIDAVQVLLAAIFLPAAVLKLAGHPHMRKEFRKFRYPYWIAILAGAMELVAAPALIVGLYRPAWAEFGGLVLLPVMAGAAVTNFTKRSAAFGWGTLVILALCAFVAISRHPALL